MDTRSSCSGGPPYMSTGSGDAPPARQADVKRILYFVINSVVSACIFQQALTGMAQPCTWLRFCGLGFLGSVALASAALFAQLTYSSWASKLTSHEESDWTLVCLAGITPAFLLLARFNPLPSSDESKANCVITFAFLLRLGALIELPPVHSFAQFVLSYPTLMFLDFHRRCNQPTRYPSTCTFFSGCAAALGVAPDTQHTCTHCCSATSFLHHLGSRGIIMLFVGVVSVAVPVIISIKKYPTIAGSPQKDAPPRRPHPPPAPSGSMDPQPSMSFSDHVDLGSVEVPLESLGLRLLSSWSPFLVKLELHLTDLAKSLDETLLVSLVCVPIGVYYFGFSICSRLMPKYFTIELVTADEWLLAMSVFFVLGRESCSMHMVTLFQQMNSKLQISQAILKDMLPDHVVNLLVNNLAQEGQHGAHGREGTDHAGAEPNGALDDALESSRPSSQSTRPSYHGAAAPRLPPSFGFPAVTGGPSSRSGLGSGAEHSTLSLSAQLKLAETHDCITVFQSDICGFSTWAHELPPQQVMMTLNKLYSRLDDVIINEFPSLYKVETIGDAYVVAGNLVSHDPNHAATVLRFAMRAQQEAAFVPRPDDVSGEPVQLRIGLHSGPAVSGIVGKLRRRFCIFGRTMDLATRTESACPPGCIQLTESTHTLLHASSPLLASEIVFKARGDVAISGFPEPVKMFLAVSKDLLVRSKMLAAAGVEM